MADETVTVLYFHAPWCGPCTQMKPTINAIESDYGEEVAVERHDIEAEDGWVDEYNIQSLPLVVIETENDTDRLMGVVGRDQIDRRIHVQYGKTVDVYDVLMNEIDVVIQQQDSIDKWPKTSLVLKKNFIQILEREIGEHIINSPHPFEVGGHKVEIGESNQFVLPSGETIELELL